MTFPAALSLALLLDVLLGDPPRVPHPVAGIGRLITFWESRLYPTPEQKQNGQAFKRGLAFCCAVVLSTVLCAGLLMTLFSWNRRLLAAVQIYFLYAAIAWRSLKDETFPVAAALLRRNIAGARTALSRVVGRDTESLDEEAVIRAAIETVAENLIDGALSVIFFAALGYAAGGGAGMVLSVWAFKAASTLDSMAGYDNARYHDFGRASARLDDILNFIPARLGGCIILLAGKCLGYEPVQAGRVFLRDRKKHRSPNSAHGESAFAGLLGLRLGGGASYGGVFEARPWLGDDMRVPEPLDILRAHKILDASVALSALLAFAFFI